MTSRSVQVRTSPRCARNQTHVSKNNVIHYCVSFQSNFLAGNTHDTQSAEMTSSHLKAEKPGLIFPNLHLHGLARIQDLLTFPSRCKELDAKVAGRSGFRKTNQPPKWVPGQDASQRAPLQTYIYDAREPRCLTFPSAHFVPASTSPGSGMSLPKYTWVPRHRIRPPSCSGIFVSMETALVPMTGRLAPP